MRLTSLTCIGQVPEMYGEAGIGIRMKSAHMGSVSSRYNVVSAKATSYEMIKREGPFDFSSCAHLQTLHPMEGIRIIEQPPRLPDSKANTQAPLSLGSATSRGRDGA